MKLKEVFARWQTQLCGRGWNSLFWNNHDLPRIVSRWGNDGQYRVESAKMLAILLHGLQGTPYIYQGEELGMTNVQFGIEDYRDIETLNLYRERLEKGYSREEIMRSVYAKSRDNARTPMQWNDEENAGFTQGTPWLKVNPNYTEIHAAAQVNDGDSVFACYRKLVHLRKEYPVFVDGDFRLLLEEDENIFAYTRTNKDSRLLVLCNFYDRTVRFSLEEDISDMELLVTNYRETGSAGTLRPYEARMLYLKK